MLNTLSSHHPPLSPYSLYCLFMKLGWKAHKHSRYKHLKAVN